VRRRCAEAEFAAEAVLCGLLRESALAIAVHRHTQGLPADEQKVAPAVQESPHGCPRRGRHRRAVEHDQEISSLEHVAGTKLINIGKGRAGKRSGQRGVQDGFRCDRGKASLLKHNCVRIGRLRAQGKGQQQNEKRTQKL